jgi:hypothetical protein
MRNSLVMGFASDVDQFELTKEYDQSQAFGRSVG